ncbi:Mur ligase family protein [Poseidonibacter ostreae]|jgi:dihydrofolate synthase / folylpolyglutamate synthase|uniref:Bifunctional folylpolyglutamate synthase/dihydrofolate synthase n=1 Tax=Poseidonibacter ostreae TaxID=2654171 RepID=A0A6L4WW13_9BACT|nr:Mur ligase family protein [Poseidonibacter ostreae]KAB7885602.1 bifunctional folylpolyglutamate synthase/dihydrofolate synthase [Poseidonibacter ostreae]KAB7890999.1 bifunctional folylpolyglutamate synthase/dihydrofolate synthase [Poseidonibacter ostreae]KAB7892723.1 bifunctional folylpolyglutamate synthase/dihydrofolate synthase [Poseidonibacter ostreae]MAC83674.1 bifunctional folylpolyglutamate synthase/dihydrofolate synthase [Arcobacter sp.]
MQVDLKKATLAQFLEFKTLYYDKIDFTIVKSSWDLLSKKITLPFVIHLVGTNGKGSTGRFLAHYLNRSNYKVLHYSSPHIIKFNERIWINGSDVSNDYLEDAHKFLQELYPIELLEKLTYFEYATLLSLYLSKDCDYLVLEAGLGGEFDATNVVENNLSLITTIDLDHMSFLGNSVEEIAQTKMRSVDNKMIVGYQIHKSVYKTALKVKEQILKERNRKIIIEKVQDFNKYELNNKFASYLKRNLHLVIACLKELKIDIDLALFDDVELFGRCQKIAKNITIDVGHNPLAARVLKEEFANKKITLIYNSYEDKDYEEVLKILKPIINKIIIIDINDKRIVSKNNLLKIIDKLNIMNEDMIEINDNEEYLVFGSFLVVEKFLYLIGINEK